MKIERQKRRIPGPNTPIPGLNNISQNEFQLPRGLAVAGLVL